MITYLDRICISVAGPRIQDAFAIGPVGWGWITGVFTISYALFEIPAGVLGDRIGPRRMLTRIVLWWSAFTSLTGAVSGYHPLLLTRFLFGAGEAGAYPNASVVISRWFPVAERGRAFGITLMSGQIGGALAPLLVVPIQIRYGWRASFYLFGALGVIWSTAWYFWYRDSPAEKVGVPERERAEMRGLAGGGHGLPWSIALRSGNFWAIMGVAMCYVYTYYFFQSWLHTYLVKAHGYSETNLLLSSFPFLVAACANCAGGMVSNALVKRIGLRWGRCAIGIVCLAISGLCAAAVMWVHGPVQAMLLLSVVYAGITFQQPIMFAVCLDVGGSYAGAMVGSMNSAAQVASFISSLVFGYLVEGYGNYDLPFIPMAATLLLGSLLWFKVDPTRPFVASAMAPGTAILGVS